MASKEDYLTDEELKDICNSLSKESLVEFFIDNYKEKERLRKELKEKNER